MNFKNQLRLYMRHQDLTIEQLAKKAGIPKSTLHNWISGSKAADIGKVKKVAQVFDTTIDNLLFGDGVQTSADFSTYQEEINAGVFEVVLRRVKK